MRSTEERTFADEARRRQIVECAIELIAEIGYPQASLAKIAERAGIVKSVVLYHFRNKDELVEAVVAAAFGTAAELMIPAIVSAASARDKLAAYIDANGEFLDRNRAAAVALFDISTSYRTADGLRLDQRVAQSVDADGIPPELAPLDPLTIIDLGISTGEFRADLPADFIKNALRATLDGAVSEVARDRDYDVLGYTTAVKSLFLRAVGDP